ncbi:MAG TPA: LacI family DNA-binding transcriptional regulator [Arthrobacter sp.]|nr:LacI family DNA-binding transcriptional regulator [Arthrobacter sp.]
MVVRLADVARDAGVSQATASRVLNGSDRKPAEEIAERVRAAAERLGYFPNAQAQALARSSAGLVGLIVHDIADPYFSSIARGVQHGLKGSGRQVLLSSTDRDGETELDALRAFMSYRTDGVVLAGSRGLQDDAELELAVKRYRDNGGKVAMIGQPLPGTSGLEVDNRGAAALLAGALLDQGHRRFAILAGDTTLTTAQDRIAGFIGRLREAGVEPERVVSGAFTRDGGYDAMSELLADPEGLLADGQICVFGTNDVMVLGALTAIRERGLRVPDDIAIAGFDDIPTLMDMYPAVTTVRLPLVAMGRMAGELMLSETEEVWRTVIEGEPVLRESTRRVERK